MHTECKIKDHLKVNSLCFTQIYAAIISFILLFKISNQTVSDINFVLNSVRFNKMTLIIFDQLPIIIFRFNNNQYQLM